MGDIGSAIKYLYSQFILRDVLSFVTPGAIVVLAALLLLVPEPSLIYSIKKLIYYSREMHWLLYIPLFGLFYVVGFAVQCFGEMFGVITYTPYAKKSCGKRFSMLWCNWKKDWENAHKPWNKSNFWWWEEAEETSEFFEAMSGNEKVLQGHERLVVLKQMCANNFVAIIVAIIIAVFFWIIRHFDWSSWFMLLAVVPLLVSLFWGHRVHLLKQYTREKVAMKRRQDMMNPGL